MSSTDSFSYRMINASICAYQIHAKDVVTDPKHPVLRRVKSPSGTYFYSVIPDFQDAVGFVGPATTYTPDFTDTGDDDIDAALVGLTQDGYAVVALRGTIPPSLVDNDILEWIKDWAQDADMPKVPWSPGGTNYGHVEKGFSDAMLALWPWIQRTLEPLLPKAPNGVLVTGHSKGAAVTFLAASLVRETWPDLAGKISVYAFAAPVVGNDDFVAAYDSAGLASATMRYQVENDLVPFLPLWKQADFWNRAKPGDDLEKDLWDAAKDLVWIGTEGGYTAVGGFSYFDRKHCAVPSAVVQTTALPAVVSAIDAGDFGTIADAHSATESYLPCFSASSTATPVA